MINVKIPLDSDFEYEKCKKLFEEHNSRVQDDSNFEDILKNTLFYSFYDKDEITLCVYFYSKSDKIWVNGYGIRKNHLYNRKCFITALSWFKCDIWADTNYKDVIWALLRCGFEKYSDGIYVFKQDKNRF